MEIVLKFYQAQPISQYNPENKMKKFKNINEVWEAIDKGMTIYCSSDSYELTIEETNIEWRKRLNFDIPFSNRDGKCLRVTCMSNWFGSLLGENELYHLYVKGAK